MICSYSIDDNKSLKIQALRGLAIIAVVFIDTTPDGIAEVACRPFLNFAVAIFLFLSGMLSDAEKWTPLKRLGKILIPYAIWTFVYTLIQTYRLPDRIIRKCFRHLLLVVTMGNCSFGIYFSHVFVKKWLTLIPGFTDYVLYPLSAFINCT